MTRKYCFLVINIILLSLIIQISTAIAIGFARISVKVIDEEGNPLEGAKLNIRFSSDSGTIKGSTDKNGILEAKAFSNDGVILGDIKKVSFYDSGLTHSFYVTKFGMWQPWNKQITVVMRPIVNPVPMYVRNRFFDFPAIGKEIGFDLMKADWVIPYGQGTQADFIFRVERRYDNVDNFDATMTLTFSNPLDGIQVVKDDGGGDFNVGSWFRLPREAPESGYHTKVQKRLSRGTYGRHSDSSDDNNYIFRVRAEVDEKGRLKRAMYGKIRGDLQFSPIGSTRSKEGLGAIGMHYYLNPDYTRNLEFDPKRNFFIGLPQGEGTVQP